MSAFKPMSDDDTGLYTCPNCGHVNTYANDIAERHCVVCKQYENGPQAWARRMEAKAWVDAFGDATPPSEIADEVARYRQARGL